MVASTMLKGGFSNRTLQYADVSSITRTCAAYSVMIKSPFLTISDTPYARARLNWNLELDFLRRRTPHHQCRLGATQSVSRADSANVCYHPPHPVAPNLFLTRSSRECGARRGRGGPRSVYRRAFGCSLPRRPCIPLTTLCLPLGLDLLSLQGG
jgi:hypothetical protein